MSPARFLREHWQKKPLLVRQAVRFDDPLTPDELAGLACEDDVESRIVREHGAAHPWEVSYGPHPEERFAELPEDGWTILVQELNRHVPAAADLLDAFDFVPNVRVDDVMVSYAAVGGSVGPHVDSYDVFLVQGMGQRRWTYGTRPIADARFIEGLDLRILQRFVPDADEILEPGDLLYLPPGFAHHGVAVTPCMTYSVGFRAPSFGELQRDWVNHAVSASRSSDALLGDPALEVGHPGAIPEAMLDRVRGVIRGLDTSDEAIDRWFASFATRLAPGRELRERERPPADAWILERLASPGAVRRSEEGRWAFLPRPRGGLRLYVGGVELDVPRDAEVLAKALCGARRFERAQLASLASSTAARALLLSLFRLGALRFLKPSRA